jgi:hypothetical protein
MLTSVLFQLELGRTDLYKSFLYLIDEFEIDIDFMIDGSGRLALPTNYNVCAHSGMWWDICPDEDCLDIILRNQSIHHSKWSPQEKFELLWTHPPRCSYDAKAVLKFIGLSRVDVQLAGLNTSDGTTMLHFVGERLAGMWADYHKAGFDEWIRVGIALVRGGANPSVLRGRQRLTPLGACLDSGWVSCQYDRERPDPATGLRWLVRLVQPWARILQEGGLDLLAYGKVESSTLGPSGSSRLDEAISINLEGYGPTPADWYLDLCIYQVLPIYGLAQIPGTYPSAAQFPRTVIWHPSREEKLEGHWHQESRLLMRKARVSSRDFTEYFPAGDTNLSARAKLDFDSLTGTQDDAGAIASIRGR